MAALVHIPPSRPLEPELFKMPSPSRLIPTSFMGFASNFTERRRVDSFPQTRSSIVTFKHHYHHWKNCTQATLSCDHFQKKGGGKRGLLKLLYVHSLSGGNMSITVIQMSASHKALFLLWHSQKKHSVDKRKAAAVSPARPGAVLFQVNP